ncbi:MAG: hypothetical protein KAH06_05385 [Desulfobacterales bacterium]|nr:hypothetical protein [Desulfobacterales bacterium]
MDKIERIEQIISEWKARAKQADNIHHIRAYRSCQDTILGLNLALDAIKGPSNTQMQTDAIVCKNHESYETFIEYKYCPDCGQLLHR